MYKGAAVLSLRIVVWGTLIFLLCDFAAVPMACIWLAYAKMWKEGFRIAKPLRVRQLMS